MGKEMSDVKISIALEEQLEEIEVHIRAARISEELRQIERALAEIAHGTSKLVFYKKETEYYLSLTDILFFETDAKTVYAHTADASIKRAFYKHCRKQHAKYELHHTESAQHTQLIGNHHRRNRNKEQAPKDSLFSHMIYLISSNRIFSVL